MPICIALAIALASAHQPLDLKPVPFTQVTIEDKFWSPKQEINRKVSIPHCLDMLEQAGNIRNLDLAASGARAGYTGFVFNDSDIYKVLEAASFALANHPDPALEKRVDGVIAKIAKAQMADGYLDTYYQINAPDKRFTNLRDNHEMYCAGHLIEGAVAHYQATRKKTFLDVATKLADNLDRTFGPGKRMGYCGHPEIELALVKLSKATGDQRYFKLAEFFVTNRGSKFFATEHNTPAERYDGTYWLDQVPIREQTSIVGHAVRAAYLLSGTADVMAEDHDAGLMAMEDKVWKNATERRMFVTGGIGPSGSNEGFTIDYDLPNLTAYQETCASIAMVMWNQRLAMIYGEAKYADLVELAMYNAVLAGGSADGSKYFYVNPLASKGNHHRQGWFSCACCPPNEARTLASLGGYAYATSPGAIWVNLFLQGGVQTNVASMKVKTNYPWDGRITYTMEKAGTYELRLRRPGWCDKVSYSLNGKPAASLVEDRGYVVISRSWAKGDTVDYWMTLPIRRIEANPKVREDQGRLALAKGPLIYCLEACDNGGKALDISIPAEAQLRAQMDPQTLGGLVTIKGAGYRRLNNDWQGGLYGRSWLVPVTFKAVPYYAWDNRAPGEMQVWVSTSPEPPAMGALERVAKVTMSFRGSNAQPAGVNDGSDPKSSGEQPAQLCHWWPHKGGEEWVQYTWPAVQTVGGSRVYFFDDTGRGECRYPDAWRIEYLDGTTWKPVSNSTPYEIRADRWCDVTFAPVKTKSLRLVLKLKEGWSTGIRQWQVVKPE